MNWIHVGLLSVTLGAPLPAASDEPVATTPLHMIVPNPPGGTVDAVARVVAHGLGQSLGRSVIVEARPGANTVIGTQLAARAAADGRTLLIVSTSFAMNPIVRSLPYDSGRDFTPVARLATVPFLVAVHPAVPAHSMQELVALARRRPGELSYASFALGQLAGEAFKRAAAVDIRFVPYQGGVQAALAVAGGHADVLIAPLSDARPYLVAGRLRPLAVTSARRTELLPELPTVGESGYGDYDWNAWIGAVVPAGTPQLVVQQLARELALAVQRPDALATLRGLQVSPAPLGPEDFQRTIREQALVFETVIRQANIKVE